MRIRVLEGFRIQGLASSFGGARELEGGRLPKSLVSLSATGVLKTFLSLLVIRPRKL